MEIRNFTPLLPMCYEHCDVDGSLFHVFVLKGTFRIQHGEPLTPDPHPDSFVMADECYGEVGESSVRVESDFSPFKPRADVYFVAPTAYSPSRCMEPTWSVAVQVGDVKKELRVTGPRSWHRDARNRWALSDPEPVDRVPIRYELAFAGGPGFADQNPVGRGGVSEPCGHPMPAHQIESVDEPVERIDASQRPEGLGPVGRSWQPRLGLAGTYDERWQQDRWPMLPEDFDFAHYNCASGGLVMPHLRGDERITCEGLHPEGTQSFELPQLRAYWLLRFQNGVMLPWPAALDTVAISLEESKCWLTWRCRFPKGEPLRVVEGRIWEGE